MIRFLPDSWRELLLRPVAMAAPDGGVYVEIMAPDFRFVFVLVLAVLLVTLLLWRRRTGTRLARPTLLLGATLLTGMVPWLLTTANGRYFIAGLLVVGPLCIGLAWLLPLTRGARLTVAALLVALQAFAVQQANPLRAWSLGEWKEAPYFQLDIPEDLRTQPATILTMSSISYSLLAPQFHVESRWMNLANAPSVPTGLPDSRRAQKLLESATPGRIFLLIPFVPQGRNAEGLPAEEVLRAVDDQLAAFRLALVQPAHCRLIRSRGLVRMAIREPLRDAPQATRHVGFWLCDLATGQNAQQHQEPSRPTIHDDAFRALEASCPRFFTPGVRSQHIPGGELRNYSSAEMKAYVLDSGVVYYKYYRAFNLQLVGSTEDVVSGRAKVDCAKIHGRSGLPWEREI